MIVTLDMLRALLEHALTHTTNPAILRLSEGGHRAEGVARAYLARKIEMMSPIGRGGWRAPWSVVGLLGESPDESGDWRLDLTDPGTAHALLTALALALDIDPGMGVVAVGWGDIACDKAALYDSLISGWGLFVGGRRCAGWVPPDWKPTWTPYTVAPTVAAEPDPVRALALAVAHVLETP